ncbi:hypothetical protein [Paraburkholderia domus]|uniref:hypothetical protein n=1 Tax=Paraburkholderia domus TaxID=2793075 RepID=UPI00191368B0|nr:hypothetical protein [Paraburkholderia domus]MBK5064783.1 hypothetical protein [Burkholderia sp. R-70199]CAE6956294.1 hypothetical protein R70199_06977 [Paraburkholderia domus]
MKKIAFGTLRFDRRSIPPDLTDLGQWPGADDSALSDEERDLLRRRIRAMTLFVDGHTPLREISRETGVGFNDLYRVFERCITQHEDGRIFGCRALIPYQHTGSYDRRSPVKPSREGIASNASGAFSQLLQRYPDIARWLERKVAERSRKHAALTEVHRHLWRLHGGFLAQCRQAGIQAHEYPFNQKYLGERSLASHARALSNRNFDAAARAAGAQQISHRWNDDPEAVRKPATRPFEAVEFDGHKIDVRLTLRIDDPFGFETLLVLHRIWILLVLDVVTRAVIGYSLALGLRAREKRWTSSRALKILESADCGMSIRLGEKVDTTTVACPSFSTSLLYRISRSSATARAERYPHAARPILCAC